MHGKERTTAQKVGSDRVSREIVADSHLRQIFPFASKGCEASEVPGSLPRAPLEPSGGSRANMGAGISVVTLERREDGEVRARPLPTPLPRVSRTE